MGPGPARHFATFPWGPGTSDGVLCGPLQKLIPILAVDTVCSSQKFSLALSLVSLLGQETGPALPALCRSKAGADSRPT